MRWYVRIAVLVLASACFLAPAAHAQKRNKNGLTPQYAKWLDEDVVYIITEEERKAFLKLSDDRDRDQFIEDFWAVRNPLHSSASNPFKEEHYRRIEYANEHFGRQSNANGWRTDMGRTWIQFGKPVSQARFIAGGQLYPCELWFYSNTTGDPSLPSFFYLLFFIPGDIGEYRYYRPYLDGPMQLVRGSQFNSPKNVYDFLEHFGGDLARAAFSLIPSDPADTTNFTVTMSSDMLVSRIQNLANDTYNVSRIHQLRSLSASVRSYFLVADQRPLEVSSVVLTDPTGQSWLDYSISVDVPELGVAGADGKSLTVATSYQLKTESGDVIVEDAQERAYPAFEDEQGKKTFKPFQIASRLPLVPGKYRLEVELHQRQSGKSFHGFQNVVVGNPATLSINGPLLVTSVQQVTHPDPATPFQYFGAQFHPSARRQFVNNSSMQILFQLQVPSPPTDYEVEYLVAHAQLREFRRAVTETIAAAQFRDGRILKSKTIPLADLPEGDYRVVLTVRRSGTGEALAASNGLFHLVPEAPEAALYFDPNTLTLGQPGVAAYIRALDALAQKETASATAYLRQAVDQVPTNLFADIQLVDLYYRSRNFAEIARLYDKLGMRPFEKSAESLAEISHSFWSVGQAERAREILKYAQEAFPGNPLVAALAKTVR
jgi:GWxTD domain-containing protein